MNRSLSAPLDILQRRAQLLARIRHFFAARGVLEVETPIAWPAGTPDPALASFVTRYTGPGAPAGVPLYLHTSPEFPMKRLLAAGSGDIYQICKVFRDGEAGRLHSPEFTLLEWYRLGFDHHDLMREVAELVTALATDHARLAEPERLSYQEAFERYAGIDPHRTQASEFADRARALGLAIDQLTLVDIDGWRDLLLTHAVEPHLGHGRLTFVYDYPPSQAALARVRPGSPALASRFELYWEGLELANGFHELNDAAEQRRRFAHQCERRARLGLPAVPVDDELLAVLGRLPDCAGVALGVDRLIMRLAGATDVRDVLTFPLAPA